MNRFWLWVIALLARAGAQPAAAQVVDVAAFGGIFVPAARGPYGAGTSIGLTLSPIIGSGGTLNPLG